MKKQLLLGVLLSSLLCVTSCGQGGGTKDNEPPFTDLITATESFQLNPGESKIITVNKDIGNKNYLKMPIITTGNLRGKFNYHNSKDSSQSYSEDFYIESNQDVYEFRQFFDAFRPTGYGLYDKVFDSIEFTNVDSQVANVEFKGLAISPKEVSDTQKEIYLERGYIKIGVDLSGGGTLTYLTRTNYYGDSIDEVITNDNRVYIGIGAKNDCQTYLSSKYKEVNLINYYDAGRQFQQSFYAAIGGKGTSESDRQAYDGTSDLSPEQNGYRRHVCYTASSSGYYWPYNPVQGGDCHENLSQIIDYQVKKTSIYIKTRALDWAYDNSVTCSYMENWYSIEDGVVYVKNRFINWAGFSYDNLVPYHTLELPATYVVHPLNTFVEYKGTKPWTNDNNFDRQSALGSWAHGSYRTLQAQHKEDWFAWVNDEDFGVAVYIPNTGDWASGRSNASTLASLNLNSDAFQSPMTDKYLYNKKEATTPYTSCYVHNTDYTAPTRIVRMKDYIPFEYTYAICVDKLTTFRNTFKTLHEYEVIDNSGMDNWD